MATVLKAFIPVHGDEDPNVENIVTDIATPIQTVSYGEQLILVDYKEVPKYTPILYISPDDGRLKYFNTPKEVLDYIQRPDNQSIVFHMVEKNGNVFHRKTNPKRFDKKLEDLLTKISIKYNNVMFIVQEK